MQLPSRSLLKPLATVQTKDNPDATVQTLNTTEATQQNQYVHVLGHTLFPELIHRADQNHYILNGIRILEFQILVDSCGFGIGNALVSLRRSLEFDLARRP